MEYANSNNILSLLDSFTLDTPEDLIRQVAENFRRRRVEKNISRQRMSELSGVPLSTLARFETSGLISFESLVKLAMASGYTADVKNLFGTARFDTMAELDLIHRKTNNKRAYVKAPKK